MDADVIVIGAGPAGCAAGIRLTLAGRRVLVLERKPREGGPDITSGELLAPVTQEECAQLGVELQGDWLLDRLYGVRNVYPDLSWTYHEFPRGFSYVHIDRGGFDATLRRRLVEVGAGLHWNSRVNDIVTRADCAVVQTTDGRKHTAPVVIDAGGRNSPSLTHLKLKSEDPEFKQIGVAVFFESFANVPVHAWDRHFYGERGAMISGSRIRPGLCRYILEADLAEKQADRLRPIEFYEQTAQRYDPWIYERIMTEPRVGDVWAMAPFAHRAREVARDRLLLAGDAAGYLAPLTGQGIEFAMRMGRLAAHTVDQALRNGDVSAAAFASYVEGRRDEVESAVAYVRHQLRVLRDRDALLRAAHDDEFRGQTFGPFATVVTARGSLRDEIRGCAPA